MTRNANQNSLEWRSDENDLKVGESPEYSRIFEHSSQASCRKILPWRNTSAGKLKKTGYSDSVLKNGEIGENAMKAQKRRADYLEGR